MNSERKNAICDFIMTGALYSKIELSVDEKIEISNITSLLSGLDLYCSNCRANKTFIYKEKSTNRLMGYFQRTTNSTAYYDDIISITYLCPSCFKKIYVEFLFIDNSMMKIAQYPSLSDVSRDELKQFQKSKIIDTEYFKEIHNLFKNENIKQACLEAFEYSKNPSVFIGSILGYIDLETWKKIDKNQLYQIEINNKAIDDKLI